MEKRPRCIVCEREPEDHEELNETEDGFICKDCSGEDSEDLIHDDRELLMLNEEVRQEMNIDY